MRKILVADQYGKKTIEADHLATFTEYLNGEAFQFVVTRAPLQMAVKVTHKRSGFSLGAVESSQVLAAGSDYKTAGKLALRAIAEKHGEARVASALRTKEAGV